MHTDEMQAAALKDLTSVVCETYQVNTNAILNILVLNSVRGTQW